MKVGDTVKLKPAMWQGIKPESYGLSFTGEYVVEQYIDMEYPDIKLEGFNGRWDAGAFQLVKEKDVSKFKVGDKVICVKNTPEVQEGWVGYVEKVFLKDGKITAKKEFSNLIYNFLPDELEVLKDNTEKSSSALDKQISGDHYKSCGIQPIEYIHANGLSYLEGNVIKYTTRHSKKNGRQDIEKAIHYLELILEMEYKDESK